MVKILAKGSYDPKLKVGCLIVSEDMKQILSCGVNGSAIGLSNKRISKAKGKSGFIHAECNAAIKCIPSSIAKVVFVSSKPCDHCSRLLINLGGITEVYYSKDYKSNSEAIFKEANIKLIKI